jgi:hypothetical protein
MMLEYWNSSNREFSWSGAWREMAITVCYSSELIWEQLKKSTVDE